MFKFFSLLIILAFLGDTSVLSWASLPLHTPLPRFPLSVGWRCGRYYSLVSFPTVDHMGRAIVVAAHDARVIYVAILLDLQDVC